MRTAVSLGVAACVLAVWSCASVQPVPIQAGDVCEGCRRPIQNVKIAAELVSPAGRLPLKFRTVSCMARYLHEHAAGDVVAFVTDHETGRLISASSAVFVRGEIDPNTRELGYYAFGHVKSAAAFVKTSGGSTSDWPATLKQVTAAGAN